MTAHIRFPFSVYTREVWTKSPRRPWWLILRVNLTGCSDIWSNIIAVCLWGCFCMRLIFELVDWVKHIIFPHVGGPYLINLRPEKNKTADLPISNGGVEGLFLPNCMICGISLFLSLDTNRSISFSWVLSLMAFRWEHAPSTLLVFRPRDAEWNYILGFPGSLACWQQILDLLSLQNFRNQFLTLHFFLFPPLPLP